ncbi:CLUMA_CG001166, isoform A [Clunio marinus]|uniref:CLUMA_CG001166, isoform A n=1 Tax=Clunio marinus TaxID=568069 RepID=A0A1J1HIY3_9DIPT|nr:CLUMA_CG001166, isoform A [Clunio marinus]
MSSACSIPGCKSKSEGSLNVFKMLDNIRVKKEWMNFAERCGISKRDPDDISFCEKHFKEANANLGIKMKPTANSSLINPPKRLNEVTITRKPANKSGSTQSGTAEKTSNILSKLPSTISLSKFKVPKRLNNVPTSSNFGRPAKTIRHTLSSSITNKKPNILSKLPSNVLTKLGNNMSIKLNNNPTEPPKPVKWEIKITKRFKIIDSSSNLNFTDHKEKCRLCLRNMTDSEKVKLDEKLAKIFSNFTGHELTSSDSFSKDVCKTCSNKLQELSELKSSYINIQTKLKECVEKEETGMDFDNSDCVVINDSSDSEDSFSVQYDHIPERVIVTDEQRKKDSNFRLCPYCGKYFENMRHGNTHITVCHNMANNNAYICDICGYKQYIMTRIKNHMKRHETPELKYKCFTCPKAFTNTEARRYHFLHTHEPKVICDTCGKHLAPGKTFRRHLETHSTVFDKVCKVEGCLERFTTSARLYAHNEQFHRDRGEFRCTICSSVFNSVLRLKRHMKRVKH